MINIPLKEGLTEGGAIILCVLIVLILVLIIIARYVLWKPIQRVMGIVHNVNAQVSQVKDNVVNHHQTNFRVEQDNRHEEITKSLGNLQENMGRMFTSFDTRLTRMDERMDDLSKAVTDTVPRREVRELIREARERGDFK